MKSSVKLSLFGAAFVALFLTYVCNARAELPPEIWHCASQEQCFTLLTSSDVIVTREGVVKGTVTGMGTGAGNLSVSNSVIIVTRTNDTMVYLYDIVTTNQCSVDVTEQCYPGTVDDIDGTMYAHVVCPVTEYVRRIPLDCSFVSVMPSNGPSPRNLAASDTQLFIGYSGGSDLGVITHPSPAISNYTTGLATVNEIVYHETTSSVYMVGSNGQNGVFVKTTPIAHGTASMFYALPQASEYMSGADTHLAVSGTMWDGQIIDISNPAGAITVTLDEATKNAISPATPGEDVRAYFVETGSMSGVRIRIFDDLGIEMWYSPDETPSWDVAYAAPTLPPVCNNGLFEPGEVCDATDFGVATCQDYSFDGGFLSCGAACDEIFTSDCWSCGDGTMNPGESCDGTDLGTNSCTDGGFANGSVSCNTNCTVNYDQCYTCGNSLIEGAEQCEGADLNGGDCTTEGFVSGILTCDTGCMYDVSTCSACGDDVANHGETCDGTDTPGMICQTLDLGYTGGDLTCDSTCYGYDDSLCYTCGDGTVDLNEECDGTNLGTLDCDSLGLGSGGTLSCFENCKLNTTQCPNAPVELCGNSIVDPLEDCDDGGRSNVDLNGDPDTCSENCKFIPPTCGVGGVDSGETCDGTDLNEETCISQGFQSGVLYCGGDCQFRVDGCSFTSGPQTISLQLDASPEPGEMDSNLMSDYESLKATLTPQCISQDVDGDLVFTTVAGSYCAVRANDSGSSEKKTMFSFIYIPENPLDEEQPVLRFYRGGTIAQNFGGNITAYKGLEVKTFLMQNSGLYQITQERTSSLGMRFVSRIPDSDITGRFLIMRVGVGSTFLCTDEEMTNCAFIVPIQGEVIIPLDALNDLSGISWKPPTDGGGCNCTTGSNSSNSFPLIFMLVGALLFWRRRNRLN